MPNVRAPKVGDGRKKHQPRVSRIRNESKTRNEESANTEFRSPFTEFWHNNQPLIIAKVIEISEGRNFCSHCGCEFPTGEFLQSPFDVCLSHLERWKYPSPDNPQQKALSSKFTSKYYCINKSCIKERFPYFRPAIVKNQNNIALNTQHKRLLKENLDVNLD